MCFVPPCLFSPPFLRPLSPFAPAGCRSAFPEGSALPVLGPPPRCGEGEADDDPPHRAKLRAPPALRRAAGTGGSPPGPALPAATGCRPPGTAGLDREPRTAAPSPPLPGGGGHPSRAAPGGTKPGGVGGGGETKGKGSEEGAKRDRGGAAARQGRGGRRGSRCCSLRLAVPRARPGADVVCPPRPL